MAEIVDPAPPGLKWLKTLLPMISTLSIFGGSITFSVIPSINDEPPNQHMSARDVRLYLSLAWIFFLFALGMSTIGQAVIEFQDKALHVAMGGNVDGDADLIKRGKFYKQVCWMFCGFPFSLVIQVLVLVAFSFLALVVAAYTETVGWVAMGFTASALVLAAVVWFLEVFCGGL